MVRRLALTGMLSLAATLAACGSAGTSRTIELAELNDSGVTGTVTLTALSATRTRVVISVDPGQNPDMPAHVHPGTCENLVPQPVYALANVQDGASTTEVPASMDELLAGGLAVNVHKSNDEMAVYTACAELR